MELTNAQLDTLETWLTANASGQTDEAAVNLLNATAAGPNNVCWKTNVTIRDVGDKLNGTELAGLSSLNHTRLLTVVTISTEGINPSLADRRQFFDDIFSGAGGATTRANLLALWKRTMTVGEKLYATGTGSDASPATLVEENDVTIANVSEARNPTRT
jgi:hypothetical protein